jgi:hypothetical protein
MKPMYLALPFGVLNDALGITKRDDGVLYILQVRP